MRHSNSHGLQTIGRRFLVGINRFLRSDSGVATVEWVALSAGVAIGAIVISYTVMHGLIAPAQGIASQLVAPATTP